MTPAQCPARPSALRSVRDSRGAGPGAAGSAPTAAPGGRLCTSSAEPRTAHSGSEHELRGGARHGLEGTKRTPLCRTECSPNGSKRRGKRSAPRCALFLFPTDCSEFSIGMWPSSGPLRTSRGPALCCAVLPGTERGCARGERGGGGQVAGGARSALPWGWGGFDYSWPALCWVCACPLPVLGPVCFIWQRIKCCAVTSRFQVLARPGPFLPPRPLPRPPPPAAAPGAV